jgi:hypothetical protein
MKQVILEELILSQTRNSEHFRELNELYFWTLSIVQKYNSFNTNTPSSESYRNYFRETEDSLFCLYQPALLSQMTPVYIFLSYFSNKSSNIIHSGLQSGLFHSGFQVKILQSFLNSPKHVK